MDKIIVSGGAKLEGKITISGAKNAVLPIIVASLLSSGKCKIQDVPQLADVSTITEVLEILGAKVTQEGNTLNIDSSNINNYEAPYDYVRKMRASVLVMGPLLARMERLKYLCLADVLLAQGLLICI